METLIFILICYGASNNLIFGSVFERFRTFLSNFGTGGYSLHKLFTCFMCLSTWMGFAVTYIFYLFDYSDLTPLGSLGVTNIWLMTFLNGLLSTAGVWLLHTLQEFLERGFVKDENNG